MYLDCLFFIDNRGLIALSLIALSFGINIHALFDLNSSDLLTSLWPTPLRGPSIVRKTERKFPVVATPMTSAGHQFK